MQPGELRGLTLASAGRLIRSKQLSPVELTLATLERIQSLNEKMATFITVTPDLAMEQAHRAEQAVADVNEQIDATRSKLERYRNRVRYSEVRIEYQPFYGSSQLGFVRPVLTAFQSIGTTLGMTTALIIYALTALIPVGLLLLAVRWLLHRFGLRIRFWRNRSGKTD